MTQQELFTCSWGVNSGFLPLQEKLNELVPFEGSVEFPRSKNKNLEKFRVAQNLLHDLFNNGLGNRKDHFRIFFGFVPVPSLRSMGNMSKMRWEQIEQEMEPLFTKIMLDAAKEQGVQNV
tara:strand:- start:211 stop:570 length:360 start_codon:yes stop_codon:yes gene_type:complete